jgi:NADH:ubiquinone oxidoreductase subunit 4 (subunit M)
MALVVGVAITAGVVPFHRRIPGLADAVPAAAAPILLAWSPLPLTVAALAALDRLVLPLAPPLTSERAALIGLVLLAIAAAAIAAWLHEDLRHVVGYLVVAELGLGVLALAVLDPAAWAPARAWMLVLATSKTALGAWALATEARFGSRRLDDLRGWARRAPLLAAGLVVAVLATFGLPGWTAWTSRSELAELVAPGLPATVAWLVGWLTAPAYLRLLLGGLARPLTRVSDAPGERPTWTRAGGVPDRSSTGGRWETIDRLREWVAANRAPIASGLVLAAALLAGLTASGIAGAGDAAAQPAPTVAGGAFD